MANRLEFTRKVSFNDSLSSKDGFQISSKSIVDFSSAVLEEVRKILKTGNLIQIKEDDLSLTIDILDHFHLPEDVIGLDLFVKDKIHNYFEPGENILFNFNNEKINISVDFKDSIKDSIINLLSGKNNINVEFNEILQKLEIYDFSVESHTHEASEINGIKDLISFKVNDYFKEGLPLEYNGSAKTPVIFSKEDYKTGLYFSGAGNINFSAGGINRLEISSAAIKVLTALDMQNIYFINNLPKPINDHQAANKAYVDEEIRKLKLSLSS